MPDELARDDKRDLPVINNASRWTNVPDEPARRSTLGHLSRKVDEILCKAILGGAKLPLREAIAFEAKCFGEVCGTEDMRIGVENFLKNGPRAKAEFVHA